MLALGLMLIPPYEAVGAAVAAVVAETVLAAALLVILIRFGRDLRPTFGFVPRLSVAVAFGVAIALVPVGPVLLRAVAAGLVFVGAAWLVGAVPEELKTLVRRRFSS